MRDIAFVVVVALGLAFVGYRFYQLGLAQGQSPAVMKRLALAVSGGSALLLILLYLSVFLKNRGLPGMPLAGAALILALLGRHKLNKLMQEWKKERE